MYGINCRLPIEIPTKRTDESGFNEDTWQDAKQKALEIILVYSLESRSAHENLKFFN